jgi:hypothetical protein
VSYENTYFRGETAQNIANSAAHALAARAGKTFETFQLARYPARGVPRKRDVDWHVIFFTNPGGGGAWSRNWPYSMNDE